MLYGNLIFIKKTGGDGSKYPVTERDIKIGRSDSCLIRIYNPQVALEHCRLIIEDSGQAMLRNLSNQTILNGKPLSHGDVNLCHGDIFKLGERLARWEYLPTSKFYKQLLSPTGRLVAVVMPQQRSLEDQAMAGTSSPISVLKSTHLGKRKFSERATSENSSAIKLRKSNGGELICRGRGDLQKLLTNRHSFKTTKLLKGAKIKERKSTSGIISSKSSKRKVSGKYRKSTLPSWKVNIVPPPGRRSSENKDSALNSNQKTGKPSKSAVKTLLENIESKSEKVLQSSPKSGIKTPQVVQECSSGELTKSLSKKVLRTPLKTKIRSLSNFIEGSVRSTRSVSKSPAANKPSVKSPSKVVLSTPKQKLKNPRLVRSETKLRSASGKTSVFSKGSKRMSLILEKVDSTSRQSLITKFRESVTVEKTKTPKIRLSGFVSDSIIQIPTKRTEISSAKKKISSKSLRNTTVKNTPEKLEKIQRRKNSHNKTLKNPTDHEEKTNRKSVVLRTVEIPLKKSKISKVSILNNFDSCSVAEGSTVLDAGNTQSPKGTKAPRISVSGKSRTPKNTPRISAKKLSSGIRRSRFSQNEGVSSASPFSLDKHFNSTVATVQTSLQERPNTSSVTSRNSSPSGAIVSSRGVLRKLSPSSSAERAAKKLKTSCPRKPDKNKKAALLVLGKASRKHLVSQNMKVLLKQKILKKAIKQSTAAVHPHDGKSRTKTVRKLKKSSSRPKSNKFRRKDKPSESSIISKGLTASDIDKSPIEDRILEGTQKSKKVLETSPPLSSKDDIVETSGKSDSKQNKAPEYSHSFISEIFKNDTSTSSSSFEKSAENYYLNSNRRCSKRLSSRNDTGRPDFIELSPTALGLIPKNMELFKTPKENKRKSSSLVTPNNVQSTGVIKSASATKIGNRKSVRFSSKDLPINSEFSSPNVSEKTEFDFSSFHTPNVTLDVFVSPLTDKINALNNDLNHSKLTLLTKDISSSSSIVNSNSTTAGPKICARKPLQSPQSKQKLSETFPTSSTHLQSSPACKYKFSSEKVDKQSKASSESKSPKRDLSDSNRVHQHETPKKKSQKNSVTEITGISKFLRTPKELKSPKNDLSDVKGVKKLLRTPKVQKSPKNDLTDVRGVKKLLRTPKLQKSPKNDLTDVRGVKKLLRRSKVQKSPKNDLTDVRGVKKLLRTPKVQKSPKNDLTDVRGVKKLLRTPKVQKSPKNDLTDVRGVKKLLRTPKVQKSPKNDLTDVRGVKKLLRTPKVQKSPKNDLTDVRGVKKLLRTPKLQKSPKNDLTDVRGVKKLLRTPEAQKSPKNDLTDVRGVKKLLRTPKLQKSPKNDLTDMVGLKKLFKSPRVQNNPKNELSDLRGIKELLGSPKLQKSPKNDLSDLINVKKILKTPRGQKSPKNSLLEVSGIGSLLESSKGQQPFKIKSKETKLLSSQSENTSNENLTNNPKMKHSFLMKNKKTRVKDFKAIRGRRTIYSNVKGPKNDLSDVAGVRELFSRHKPISDYNTDLTGVLELFEIPKTKDFEQKVSKIATRTYKKLGTIVEETSNKTRRGRKREATEEETEKKRTRRGKLEAVTNLEEKKPTIQKVGEELKASRLKRASAFVKQSQKAPKKDTKTVEKKLRARTIIKPSEEKEVSSKKRKILHEDSGISPPKLRRRKPVLEESSSAINGTSKKSTSRVRSERTTKKENPVKGFGTVLAKARSNKTSATSSKVQSEREVRTGKKKINKVQSRRSQTSPKQFVSKSAEKLSLRKTRRAKLETTAKTQSKETEEEIAKSSGGRKKLSLTVKKSTRRK